MNEIKKDKALKSNLRKLMPILILFLSPLFKNFDWERFEFTDCNESSKPEQSFDYSSINQVKERRQTELTFETLKQYKGFENISEDQAVKEIDNMKKLAKILFHLHTNEQAISI